MKEVKEINVLRLKIKTKDLAKKTPLESDANTLINYDCLVFEDGKPIILYIKLDDLDTSLLRAAVKSLKFVEDARASGLKTISEIFGYRPRNVLRNDYCNVANLRSKMPNVHNTLTSFAAKISTYYEAFFPEVYKNHKEIVKEKIKPEWVIPNSFFTSGIVNKNSALKYHYDRGNFKDMLSSMITFKRDLKGGRLICPEYGIKFECADNTLLIFNGQSILHGVSPIEKLTKSAYRYTTVYYSLEQLWQCETLDKELLRIRQKKTDREIRRLK